VQTNSTPAFAPGRRLSRSGGVFTKSDAPIETPPLDDNNASRYHSAVIKSFGDKETQKLANGEFSRRLPKGVQHRAKCALIALTLRSHWTICASLRHTGWNRLKATGKDNGAIA